jgi:hypothetical protein
MGSLAFFPWLRVTEPVSAGDHSLLLYSLGSPFPESAAFDVDVRTVERILRQYKVRRTESISTLNLLVRHDKPVGSSISDVELAEARRFARHLAVAGLAARSFVGSPWEFAATGHFQLVVQAFSLPFDGRVAYQNRIKGGTSSVSTSVDMHDWPLPSHLLQPVDSHIDVALLAALGNSKLDARVREHLEASLTQYLLANSSAPDVPFDVETLATYTAIERVCDANQSLVDCIGKVQQLLEVAHGHPYAPRLRNEMCIEKSDVDSAVTGFLTALYVVRGALAHGHIVRSSKGWVELDLQVAGAFLFPLLLKCKLAQQEAYKLTLNDAADVAGLGVILNQRPFAERDAATGKTRWEEGLECVDEAKSAVEIELILAKEADRGS